MSEAGPEPLHERAGEQTLAELLAAGERAVFHGRPADAVVPLERAVGQARAQGQPAETAAAAWLLGVALAAGGRCGSALQVLTPLVDGAAGPGASPELRLFGALAAATSAGVHRQLGRHATAREADLGALALAGDRLAGAGVEAHVDALLGLAADAVGLDDAAEAAARVAQAAELLPAELLAVDELAADDAVPEVGDPRWWRQRTRLASTRAEVALLQGDPVRAVALARAAVRTAREASAPQHVSAALLLQGVAEVGTDDGDAVATLREAADLAADLGALPVLWRARALLGALVAATDPGESRAGLAAARSVLLELAADLPPQARADWVERPEVAALLHG